MYNSIYRTTTTKTTLSKEFKTQETQEAKSIKKQKSRHCFQFNCKFIPQKHAWCLRSNSARNRRNRSQSHGAATIPVEAYKKQGFSSERIRNRQQMTRHIHSETQRQTDRQTQKYKGRIAKVHPSLLQGNPLSTITDYRLPSEAVHCILN